MSVLVGSQSPRVAYFPKYSWSAADDAAFLGSSYGMDPDPWQFTVIQGWLAEDAAGKLVAGQCGLAVARQNGKNGVLEIVELYKMVVQHRKILHTAHEVKTARKHFLRMTSYFDNERKFPELFALTKEVRRTNGQEAIVLHTEACEKGSKCDCKGGASIEFIARSKSSGRGFTVDDLVCDEAQDLTDEQLEALLPTISSAPSGDPQQIYTGTPPGPNASGDVFSRLRKLGVLGKARRVAWFEWSLDPNKAPAALKLVKAAKDGSQSAIKKLLGLAAGTNPALGSRLNATTVVDEISAMSPEGFLRERLGWWETRAAGVKAIAFNRWSCLEIDRDEVPTQGRRVYSVNFAWDGSGVALAAAIRPPDGPIHVDPIRQEPMGAGTLWLSEWLLKRWRNASQIVIYGKGQAESLINALREGGIRNKRIILTPSFSEAVGAHAMFENAIKHGELTHLGLKALDNQVAHAIRQPIGKSGGFGWAAPDGESVIMLNAVTFAYWSAQTTKRNPSSASGGVTVL